MAHKGKRSITLIKNSTSAVYIRYTFILFMIEQWLNFWWKGIFTNPVSRWNGNRKQPMYETFIIYSDDTKATIQLFTCNKIATVYGIWIWCMGFRGNLLCDECLYCLHGNVFHIGSTYFRIKRQRDIVFSIRPREVQECAYMRKCGMA